MGAIGVTEVQFESGRKVTIDLRKITIAEFRLAVDQKTEQNAADGVLAKACGLKTKDIQNLPMPDYQQLVKAWWEAATQPLTKAEKDEKGKPAPNSQSESTEA